MPEDRSLDEFGGSDAEAEPTETDPVKNEPAGTEPSDAADADSSPPEPDDGAVVDDPAPATATSTWTAGGADCERCGERVERRWLDDGDRVCPDCKSW